MVPLLEVQKSKLPMKPTILTHISEIVTPEGKKALHGKEMGKVKRQKDGAIVIENGKMQL